MTNNAVLPTVLEYLDRFPNAPDLTIAKAIYSACPGMFRTVETARSRVRYYRGTRGPRLRGMLADKSRLVAPGRTTNPFSAIPPGMRSFDEWEPLQLPENKTLVIADTHVPYHDSNSLTLALEYGYKVGVDGILILGDFLDFYAVSRWQTDPRKRNLWGEIEAARQVLGAVRGGFPNAKIRVKKGNHDERYERWLWVKAPELLDVPDFQYERFLHFEEHGVEVMPERQILRIGGLNLLHGHEFGRMFSSPVNPARGVFMRGKAHCLCGHWHSSSYSPETTMEGKIIGCWSVGCMCDLHPEYMPINRWAHGFAIVDNLGGDDEFLVHNHTIVKGKVY